MTRLAVALLRAWDRADSALYALPLAWRPWLAAVLAPAALVAVMLLPG
jgi:hypothetical protein